MTDKSRYTEVNSSNLGTKWDVMAKESNNMAFKKDDPNNIKEGYYANKTEMPGKEKPFLIHSIQTVNPDGSLGEIFSCAPGKVADENLEKVPLGSWICIEYKGRKHKKGIPTTAAWTQTNSYHDWFIGYDAGAIPFAEAQKKTAGATTAAATPQPAKQTIQQPAKPEAKADFVSEDDSDLPF